jgi:hypothetical protein
VTLQRAVNSDDTDLIYITLMLCKLCLYPIIYTSISNNVYIHMYSSLHMYHNRRKKWHCRRLSVVMIQTSYISLLLLFILCLYPIIYTSISNYVHIYTYSSLYMYHNRRRKWHCRRLSIVMIQTSYISLSCYVYYINIQLYIHQYPIICTFICIQVYICITIGGRSGAAEGCQ